MLENLEEYFRHLNVLNRSPETIDQHKTHLKKWVTFCAVNSIKSLQEVTPKHARLYQVYLYELRKKDGKPYSVSVQNGILAIFKVFMAWAYLEGLTTSDPAKALIFAKQPKRLPKTVLTTTEVRRMLNMPEMDRRLGYRDKTLLEVFYATMGRRGEIAKLMLNDLDFENGVIRINLGKGAKDRAVPMGKVAARYLKHYIAKIRPHLVKSEDPGYVFLSLQGNKLSRSMPWSIVKKYAKASGIAKNIFPHCFRASGLTHMLRNNANVRHLMEIAGHASMESLNSYLAVEISDLKETHAKTHPRELEGDR